MNNHLARRLFVALVAGSALAVPFSSQAGPPPLQAAPTTHLAGFRITPLRVGHGSVTADGWYTGGSVGLTVDVQNTADAPQTDVTVQVTSKDGLSFSQQVSVPAHATLGVNLADPTGLASGCEAKHYDITVTSSAGTHSRGGAVTPSCRFTSTVEDPWNLAEPDRVADAQKDSVYVTNVVAEPSTCATGLRVKGAIINHTKLSGPSLLVQGADASAAVRVQTAAAFPLATGAGKDVVLTSYGRPDVPERVRLSIVDWQHIFGSHIQNQGIVVKTTRACSLTAGFIEMTLAPAH